MRWVLVRFSRAGRFTAQAPDQVMTPRQRHRHSQPTSHFFQRGPFHAQRCSIRVRLDAKFDIDNLVKTRLVDQLHMPNGNRIKRSCEQSTSIWHILLPYYDFLSRFNSGLISGSSNMFIIIMMSLTRVGARTRFPISWTIFWHKEDPRTQTSSPEALRPALVAVETVPFLLVMAILAATISCALRPLHQRPLDMLEKWLHRAHHFQQRSSTLPPSARTNHMMAPLTFIGSRPG